MLRGLGFRASVRLMGYSFRAYLELPTFVKGLHINPMQSFRRGGGGGCQKGRVCEEKLGLRAPSLSPKPLNRVEAFASGSVISGGCNCFGRGLEGSGVSRLLSNQGEKSINFYFIMVPFKEKVLKYGSPKPSLKFTGLGFRIV